MSLHSAMRGTSLASLVLAFLAGSLAVSPSLSAASLDEVLSKMDQAGKTLRSMEATIVQKKWTQILEEYDEGERGRFTFLRDDGKVYLRKDIVEPTSNTLVIRDGSVLFYQPSIKQAQEYRLGENKDKAEFLLLGFGSDRKMLGETYEIALLGEEEVDGRMTYRLELKPKSGQVAAFFVRIVLWVDAERWIPVQQQLVEPTEDHLLITFSDIRLNPKTAKSFFDLKLPKEVKVLRN